MALPSYWQQAWDEAEPRLRHWREQVHAIHISRVLRVGQLDAELLDEDLVQMLNEPLAKALNLINSAFRSRLEPELVLIIRLTLYKFSLWDSGATYGAKLQDLRYYVRNGSLPLAPSGLPSQTLFIHAFLTICVPYIHSRFRNRALSQAWPDLPSQDRRRKAWGFLNNLESLHSAAALAGFIAFLWNGRYRTLADRLLSMRLVPSKRFTNRQVSYEFMNRQMVWHAFTEFLLLALPLIASRAFRRAYKQLASRLRGINITSILPSAQHKTSGPATILKGRYFSLSTDQCAICAEKASFDISSLASNPGGFVSSLANHVSSRAMETPGGEAVPPSYPINTPYRASCGHEYCYFCLSEKLLRAVDDGDDGWECVRCKELVRSGNRIAAPADEGYEVDSNDLESDIGTPFESEASESLSSISS